MRDEISFVPGDGEVHGSDLQKGFHEVLSTKSDVEALKFLLENYEKNPRFAERQALKMSAGLSEELQKLFFQSSIDEVRANLHDDFKKLSGKQQTKVGGYKGFVQQCVSEIEAEVGEFLPEEQRMKLLEGSHRTITLDGKVDSYWSKSRTTFLKLSASRSKMSIIQKIIEKG